MIWFGEVRKLLIQGVPQPKATPMKDRGAEPLSP